MRIERYNGGTLRRYHLRTGVLVTTSGQRKTCGWIPNIIPHITVDVSRTGAAAFLRAERVAQRGAS